jgi:hypothetical protein
VLNFLLHRPEDASEIFTSLINHPAIKKCNFTGSTHAGRIIASQAAASLKPVLLELGGKNFTIVLDNADLDLAAGEVVEGAFLNVSTSLCRISLSWILLLITAEEWSNLHVNGYSIGYKACSANPRDQNPLHATESR